MKNLIGIYSPTPQSGKSTVFEFLNDIAGFERMPFASYPKEIASYILQITGVPDSDAQRLVYTDKEEQIPGFPQGVTARFLLQQLGTNFARDSIDPTIWVRAWANTVSTLPDTVPNIVVDDVRFENEARTIREMGGYLWKVERPGPKVRDLTMVEQLWSFLKSKLFPGKQHHSEGNLNHFDFDVVIVNDGSLDDLREKVMDALGSVEK